MMGTAVYGAPAGLSSESEQDFAREASRALAKLTGNRSVHVDAVAENGERQSFVLPASAVRLLMDMMTHLANGQAVAVIPEDADLTTQQAADMLNVSRPFLIGLLEKHALPYRLIGTHRRVTFRDVVAYRAKLKEQRRTAIDGLVAEAQELGLGY